LEKRTFEERGLRHQLGCRTVLCLAEALPAVEYHRRALDRCRFVKPNSAAC